MPDRHRDYRPAGADEADRPMTFRHTLLRLHRWLGLVLAAFLVLAGTTGSLLAFHHEIDAALTPDLHRVVPQAVRASLDDIAARIEARHPDLAVGYFVFTPDPASSIRAVMNTREAANAGRLDRDAAWPSEVYVDPYSGRILGERKWGELGATRAHVVPMIYRLHMSLFMGTAGQWITAIVAALLIGMLVMGTILAFPKLRVLGRSFTVKWRASRARTFFDVHRTVGLAAGWLLAVMAFTGLYMNLPSVVEPAIAAVAPFTERPAAVRTPSTPRHEVWKVGWDRAYSTARAAQPIHPVVVFARVEAKGYYQLRFMPPDDIVDAGTIRLFVDGRNAALLGRFEDRNGTAGDLIRIWQFPLHSGQGFGLPGRILVCVTGALPLLLAGTGVWLWLRRRRLRSAAAAGH